jgi:hypothetical protein
MAQFVTKLVGKLAPIAVTDRNDNPRRARRLGVEPDRRLRPRTMVYPQPFRLTIRNKAEIGKTNFPHPCHDA